MFKCRESDLIANTFSMVSRDPSNGDLGVVVASKVVAVGAVVPYAKAGVGAVATQAAANVSYGPQGLERMAGGESPMSAVVGLTSRDSLGEIRQVGMVDASGDSFAFTGKESDEWKGHVYERDFACQSNLLAGEAVISEMVEAFKSVDGELSKRLMVALLAGDAAGGDRRGGGAVGGDSGRASGPSSRLAERPVLRPSRRPSPGRL